MRQVCRAAIWMVAMLLQVASVYGQANTATIRGRVHDAQGASVPSASVTVSSRDTGLTRTVQVDRDGSFVIPSLVPATVDVSVAAAGFAPTVRNGVVLEVGQTVAVDIELSVRGVQETVDVSAGAAAVDTTRSTVDAVIPSTAIEALPLIGREPPKELSRRIEERPFVVDDLVPDLARIGRAEGVLGAQRGSEREVLRLPPAQVVRANETGRVVQADRDADDRARHGDASSW